MSKPKAKTERKSVRISTGIKNVDVWLHPISRGRINFQLLTGWDAADQDLTRKQLEKIRDGITKWLEGD